MFASSVVTCHCPNAPPALISLSTSSSVVPAGACRSISSLLGSMSERYSSRIKRLPSSMILTLAVLPSSGSSTTMSSLLKGSISTSLSISSSLIGRPIVSLGFFGVGARLGSFSEPISSAISLMRLVYAS